MVQPLNYVMPQYGCLCDELVMDQSKLYVPFFLYECAYHETQCVQMDNTQRMLMQSMHVGG